MSVNINYYATNVELQDIPSYSTNITVEGQLLKLSFLWNERIGKRVLSIKNSSDVVYLQNTILHPNEPLELNSNAVLDDLPYSVTLVKTGDINKVGNIFNWSKDFILCFSRTVDLDVKKLNVVYGVTTPSTPILPPSNGGGGGNGGGNGGGETPNYFEWWYYEGFEDFGFTVNFPTPVEVHYPDGEVDTFIAQSGVNSLSYQEGLYRVVGDFYNLLTDAYLRTSPINSAPSTPVITSYVRLQNDMVEISGTATPDTVACLYEYDGDDEEIAFSPVDTLGYFTFNVKLPPNFSWYIKGRRGTYGSAKTDTYVV